MSLTPSLMLTLGVIIILINVIEAMIHTGSEMMDSMVNMILVAPRSETVFSILPSIPKTATVLVPPIMAPSSIPSSNVKSLGSRKLTTRPTTMIELNIDETDNRVALPMLLMRVAISTLMPASNNMMLKARILIKGANSLNNPLSIYPIPDPMRTPNPINQITSGILVNR